MSSKKLLLFFFYFSFIYCVQAQQLPILYQNNFDNEKNTNFIIEFDDMKSRILDSNLVIVKKGNLSGHVRHSIYTNDNKDYKMEVKLRQTNLKTNKSLYYGIVFNTWEKYNNYFLINHEGKFKIMKKYLEKFYNKEKRIIIEEKNIIIKEKKESIISKKVNKWNMLTIERKGKNILFFINYKKIFETTEMGNYGNEFGFYVSEGDVIVEVDNIAIYQEKTEINLSKMYFIEAEKEVLSNNVNTTYNELVPVISPDGKILYFTADYPENSAKQDVFISELKESIFQPSKSIGSPINNPKNNTVYSIFNDGKSLLIGNNYNSNGSMEKGLSITEKVLGEWGFPKSLKIKNYYNQSNYSEASISNDGKVILMTLERNDTYGSKDIYVSFLIDNNSWTEPKNIGNIVNSNRTETGVFIANDNKTVFFSTDGRAGFGGSDIFVTKRLDDTWLNWSEPENLGKNVNTEKWEAYFSIDANMEYGYFCSYDTKGIKPNSDIFRIKLPESFRKK